MSVVVEPGLGVRPPGRWGKEKESSPVLRGNIRIDL
jgi:hypothetical protein